MLTKADKTRQFIIEKSAHLFNTKGFYGTSMRDILKATGLAKGGVYGNFKSKEAIAIEAFEYAYQTVSREISMKIRAQSHALDKLKAIIDYYKDYSTHSPIQGGCPLLNIGVDVDDTVPAIQEKVTKAIDQMLHSLTYIIEKGKERSEIKPDVNASEMADIIFSQIEGGIMLAKLSGNVTKLNRLLKNLKLMIDREMAI